MREQRITVGDIERGVLGKRIAEINAAQAELQRVSETANETFSLFCAIRSLPQTTQFVKIEGDQIVVSIPDTTPAATEAPAEG